MAYTQTVISNGKDIYEIIDTIVKIGLGALIGGIFSFITLKSNQKHEVSKEKRAYKIKNLDSASIILEEYFKASYNLMNCYYGYSTSNYKKPSELDKVGTDRLLDLDKKYLESINRAQESISKFNIINLHNINTLIESHDIIVIKERNQIMAKNATFPNFSDIDNKMDEMVKIKKRCHFEINQYFEKLE